MIKKICCILDDFWLAFLSSFFFFGEFRRLFLHAVYFLSCSVLFSLHDEEAAENCDKQVTYGFKFKRDDPKKGIICFPLTILEDFFISLQKRQIVESVVKRRR